jgi:phosphatidate cytidylyltransferase
MKRPGTAVLSKRVLSAAIFIPACLLIVIVGGWLFILAVCALLGLAAWEFWHMFQTGRFAPNPYVLIGGVVLIALSKTTLVNDYCSIIFSALVMIAMAVHTINYERGGTTSGIDFCITIAGLVYVGLLGSYLISLRLLPDGLYWIILAILGVGISDIGAYFIGSSFGVHKISTRVSPSKSLEGYLGGVVFAGIFGILFGSLAHPFSSHINATNGLLLNITLALVALPADLGKSMLKRQFNLKDASNLIPGHGGILDRIDTWLWAAAISFYLISWFWL